MGLNVARSAFNIERLVTAIKKIDIVLDEAPLFQVFGNFSGIYALVHWLDVHLAELSEIISVMTITDESAILMSEINDCFDLFRTGRNKKKEDSIAAGLILIIEIIFVLFF